MAALSFKRRFVAPICTGLGREIPKGFFETIQTDYLPKRQTIRSGRVIENEARSRKGRLLARIGGELQLYCGMRTKGCFLIGRARCIDVQPIQIRFWLNPRLDGVRCRTHGTLTGLTLDGFAVLDGFRDWEDMRKFWTEEHPNIKDFEGVLIRWEPS
jgi:hypothetical protein